MKLHLAQLVLCSSAAAVCFLPACRTPQDWKEHADRRAGKLISAAQTVENGDVEEIDIETPSDSLRRRLLLTQDIPYGSIFSLGSGYTGEPAQGEKLKTEDIELSLMDAVSIAAAGNSEYQSRKESLYRTALALDLEDHGFRSTFSGIIDSELSTSKAEGEDRVSGSNNSLGLGVKRRFKNGVEMSGNIAVDLAKMLSAERDSAWGVLADMSVSVPLLRGSGRFVVEEPLIQAQRDLLYAVRSFEQYKREFVVSVASSYMDVLLYKKRLRNQEDNYRRAIVSTRRSRRMADAGRLQEYEFDQSFQNELSARNSWISAQSAYEGRLESFRILLGLPPESRVFPKNSELEQLSVYASSFAKMDAGDYDASEAQEWDEIELVEPDGSNAGPMEIDEDAAVKIALSYRPDLRTASDRVQDAERAVRIAADRLRAELTIGGRASAGERRSYGSASDGDGDFSLSRGNYSALLNIDLPFDRYAERNEYRNSLIALESAVRDYQSEEDKLKQSVREQVRGMNENRETLTIQFMAVSLAERRVESMNILMQAGRAEMNDFLDAQQSLLSAQNSLYSAIVGYRIDELNLQCQLGILDVSVAGLWKETRPSEIAEAAVAGVRGME